MDGGTFETQNLLAKPLNMASCCTHVTHQLRRMPASGTSGSTSTKEVLIVPRVLPLKSPTRADLTATTGCPPCSTIYTQPINSLNKEHQRHARSRSTVQNALSHSVDRMLLYWQARVETRDQLQRQAHHCNQPYRQSGVQQSRSTNAWQAGDALCCFVQQQQHD